MGHLILDFDRTLGDTRQTIVTTMQMTAAELGLPDCTDNECASTIGLPLEECFKPLYPNEREKTCGVTYGNGTMEELEQADADYII